MREFADFWSRMFVFSGRTSVRGYWVALWIWLILSIPIAIVEGLISLWVFECIPEILGVQTLYNCAGFVAMLSATVRRLNDAGYSWKSLFWLLIPGVGMIALIARLIGKAKA